MTTATKTETKSLKVRRGKFYVVDMFGCGCGAEVLPTPFDSREAAEVERRQLNVAGDCVVMSAEEIVEKSRKS